MDDTNTPAPRKRRRTDPELTVTRDAKGRFLKGSQANPYGRPPRPKRNFTLDQQLTDCMPIYNRLRTVMRAGKSVEVSNRQLLLERAMEEAIRTGKPQLIKLLLEHDAKLLEHRTAYIAHIREQLAIKLSGVESIRDLSGRAFEETSKLLLESEGAEHRPNMYDVEG